MGTHIANVAYVVRDPDQRTPVRVKWVPFQTNPAYYAAGSPPRPRGTRNGLHVRPQHETSCSTDIPLAKKDL